MAFLPNGPAIFSKYWEPAASQQRVSAQQIRLNGHWRNVFDVRIRVVRGNIGGSRVLWIGSLGERVVYRHFKAIHTNESIEGWGGGERDERQRASGNAPPVAFDDGLEMSPVLSFSRSHRTKRPPMVASSILRAVRGNYSIPRKLTPETRTLSCSPTGSSHSCEAQHRSWFV